jgi:hypothetical protein
MTAREMQVNGAVRKFRVSQENLNGSEVSTCFQHVRCEGVPQCMWGNSFSDPGPLNRLFDRYPNDLVDDGDVSAPVVHYAGEQVGLRLHPTPILA